VKPKSKSCRKHLFTVNKLLRLWYFVSVLNLKFWDLLERRHCQDTPFCRPFYIRAPKGPFLWGLRIHCWVVYRYLVDIWLSSGWSPRSMRGCRWCGWRWGLGCGPMGQDPPEEHHYRRNFNFIWKFETQ
jgi:hypothetical protein